MEKTPNTKEEESLTRKLHELLAELDNEETEKFCFQEEMVEEVMQELYKEIAFSTSHAPLNPPNTIFIDDAKNESCEALVLSSTSTMMAGIEVVTKKGSTPIATTTEKDTSCQTLFELKEKKMVVFDDKDHLDCEWVGRILKNWLFF
ncbi:hypothetical protein CR513_58607, partial [Mucuna pruriens]